MLGLFKMFKTKRWGPGKYHLCCLKVNTIKWEADHKQTKKHLRDGKLRSHVG